MVGSANIGSDMFNHAFLWSDGTATDLNTLPNHAGWEFHGAVAINDKGEIVVVGENGNNGNLQVRYFLLTPDVVGSVRPSK